jgi:hypothetical protein
MNIVYANSIDPNYPKDYARDYLNQFLPNQTCFLFTDNNINRFFDIDTVLSTVGKLDFILIDLTHNPVGLTHKQFSTTCKGNLIRTIEQLVEYCELYAPTVVLHCDFNYQSDTKHYFYFPLWLWMWSAKKPLWYANEEKSLNFYDALENKTQGLCCLNRTPTWHRILFFNSIVEKPWFSKISYTFGNHGHGKQFEYAFIFLTQAEITEFESKKHYLPFKLIDEDKEDTTDVGVSHPVWSTHTFNLVTESAMDNTFLSEKTAKPFITKMIPIILGPKNAAQHLQAAGLDMFEDIIPWHTWDHLPESRDRIDIIVNFLEDFLKQDLVAIYHANKHRVDRNKEFFHSEEFRKNLLKDMVKLSSSSDILQFFQ